MGECGVGLRYLVLVSGLYIMVAYVDRLCVFVEMDMSRQLGL